MQLRINKEISPRRAYTPMSVYRVIIIYVIILLYMLIKYFVEQKLIRNKLTAAFL